MTCVLCERPLLCLLHHCSLSLIIAPLPARTPDPRSRPPSRRTVRYPLSPPRRGLRAPRLWAEPCTARSSMLLSCAAHVSEGWARGVHMANGGRTARPNVRRKAPRSRRAHRVNGGRARLPGALRGPRRGASCAPRSAAIAGGAPLARSLARSLARPKRSSTRGCSTC
jgi:hypothetical protein